MDGPPDPLDRWLLALLQQNSRATLTEMADRLGVAANTVRSRLTALEEAGVVADYTVALDYARAGLPFRWLFVCTASVAEREVLGERAADVEGVVEVLELMTGERNLVIEAVGADRDGITAIARQLDDLGLRVVDEALVRNGWRSPVTAFGGGSADD